MLLSTLLFIVAIFAFSFVDFGRSENGEDTAAGHKPRILLMGLQR
jgi:hypothetical protein